LPASTTPTRVTDLFRNPVTKKDWSPSDGVYRLVFDRPMACFNSIKVSDALAEIPAEASTVVLHLTDRVTLIDHTSCDLLLQFASDFEKSGRGRVVIEGLDRMCGCSHERSSMKLAPWALDNRHHSKLSSIARFGLGMPSKARMAEEMAIAAAEPPFVHEELAEND